MTVKIYLAAMYSHKAKIAEAAKELESLGYQVVSTWHTEPWQPSVQMKDLTEEDHRFYATRDIKELESADRMIFFAEEGATPRGGRHVEYGYALCLSIPIMVIGPYENIFHYYGNVTHVPTWQEAINRIANRG